MREIQIKIVISPHTCQNGYYQKVIARVGKNIEKRESSFIVHGNVNWCSQYGKEYGDFSDNQKQNYHMIQQFCFWGFIYRKRKHLKVYALPYSLQHYLQ